MRSVRLLGYVLPALHAPPACRSVETPRPPSFSPLRQAGGRSFSGSPLRFFLAQGGGQAWCSPSLRRASTHAHPLKWYCVFFRVSPFGFNPGALAGSVAPLPLLVRSPLRFRSVASTRSALRLKKRETKILWYLSSIYGLPYIATANASARSHFDFVIDHSALTTASKQATPSARSARYAGEAETPVK